MSRVKPALLAILITVLVLVSFSYYFYSTGGMGLYRIVVHYLIPDLPAGLPQKQYTWADFVYKGENNRVAGFYAFGDENSFRLWTLSGLKRFYAKPGTSVYNFRDTCKALKEKQIAGVKNLENPNQVFFVISDWNGVMQPEYFAVVQTLGKEDGRMIVDKTWGVSGRYKVLNRLDEGVCD